MKNLIQNLVGAVAGIVVAVVACGKAEAQAVVVGGYPMFVGQFIHAGPNPDSISNSAPLVRVANPLTSGGNYTNPPTQGFITVNCVFTNGASSATLSNVTTGANILIGSVTTTSGTNYANATIRVGPSEVVLFTNISGTLPILSSEWRN